MSKLNNNEKTKIIVMIRDYIYRINQDRIFIYYDGDKLHSVMLPEGKEKTELNDMIERFVYDGGVAILRYTNPMHDGTVIVNGFVSSGEMVENIPGKDLKRLMEQFEPEERRKFYQYQPAFIHFPA